MTQLVSPEEMAKADRLTIEAGIFSGIELMRRAGAEVVAAMLARFPEFGRVQVLCGPGNNGGDGYVVAELLRRTGVNVSVYVSGSPKACSDAALAANECALDPIPLAEFEPDASGIVVDALFGAGLARAIDGDALRAIQLTNESAARVMSVDLPSGVSGATGQILGSAFEADLTVTFARKKPGHLLTPGRRMCGDLVVADIGIPESIIAGLGVKTHENSPSLWEDSYPSPETDAHKYSRGHVAVCSGDAEATGAARLSAMAAARVGAGAVTVLSPSGAVAVNAAHLTSIMLKRADSVADILAFARERKPQALVYGPGLSPEAQTGVSLMQILDGWPQPLAAVVDASALTSLARKPELFMVPARSRRGPLVITPHEGEFKRLFPDLSADKIPSKLERARLAAARVDAVVVYKGPDTVIAAADGRAAINSNGVPLLATAGSGDVLSGFIAGLLAQGAQAFEAACAAVWIHAEAAREFGPGLIAEDLPMAILPVVQRLKLRIGQHRD